MRGDLLDVVLLVAAVLFAVSGYRQGFVVGVLSFVGFLGGGLVGARIAPTLAASDLLAEIPAPVTGLVTVFLCATVGQLLATAVGGALRERVTWRSARFVDAVLGSCVSVASVLLVAWLVGTAVASSPYPTLAGQVRRSAVIAAVDDVVPAQGRAFVKGFQDLLDTRGFPEVFGDLAPTPLSPVDPPNAALQQSPVVQAVRPSVLKITGDAEDCGRQISGTGFVYAPERVMTNAHVVAGVDAPRVELPDGERLDAVVVQYDPDRDVAVLLVPGLRADALAFAPEAASGSDALVVGFPENLPYRADPARVGDTRTARGPDIYGEPEVRREIYTLRGRVRPGNSGGPLLTPQGDVYGVVFAAAADRLDVGYALTAAEVAPVARAGAASVARVDTLGCD